MVAKTIDCYEIDVKIIVRKDYLDSDIGKGKLEAVLKDRIQQGIEVPLEKISIVKVKR